MIKLALIQTDLVWENIQENLDKFDTLLQDLKTDTDIVILPEVFSTGFALNPSNFEKPVGKKAFNWLKNKAISLKKVLVASILFEENKKYYNRMFWIRPDGSFDYYDKRHLFQMGDEHKVMTAGDKHVIVSYKGMRFMLQICYDLRFPVWVKNKYDKKTDSHDYDALIYIANWPTIRKHAYMSLLKARAIENQSYVVWVNRIGVNNEYVSHSGDTQVVDHFGNIQDQMPKNKDGILYSSLKLNSLTKYRKDYKIGLDWDEFIVK